MSLNDDNPRNKNSAPESLGQVLNSLQNIIEHKRFPFSDEQDKSRPILDKLVEPFSEQAGELYDDPLYPDDGNISSAQDDDIDIPVLDDIIFKGLENDLSQSAEIESQLKQLRAELDAIVGDIMNDARQQFESGDSLSPAENNLQRFLRELDQRNLK